MPRHNRIVGLPADVRNELDRRIYQSRGTQIEHSAWLRALGFSVSKNTVWRYSLKLMNGVEALRWIENRPEPGAMTLDAMNQERQTILSPFLARDRELADEIHRRIGSENGLSEAAS